MAKTADNTVEDLDTAMRALRAAVRGIPFRAGSFRTTHHNLTRDVAFLMVQIDSARGATHQQIGPGWGARSRVLGRDRRAPRTTNTISGVNE